MASKLPLYDFHLLEASHYLAELTRHVERAKRRVYIMCPIITNEAAIFPLIKALMDAAQRGVEVNIAADVYTYGELGGYVMPFKRRRAAARSMNHATQRLQGHGADFVWLGKNLRRINPFSGVTHIKWSIVDDTVYSFGGTNLYKDGIESVDYMLVVTHAQLAQEFVRQQKQIILDDSTAQSSPDFATHFPYGELLVDHGMRHASVIYERVCDLAEQAEEILLVTQFCPSGRLARSLRTRPTRLYFNNPRHTDSKIGAMLVSDQLRTRLRTKYHHKRYLHAKFAVFTMPDGSKKAITGSHNFSYFGVRFGTREVALETEDPAIIRQLEEFFETYVK